MTTEITPRRKNSGRERGYIPNYDPRTKTIVLLGQIKEILEEYRDHWPLTVRQIFYRLIGAYGHDKSEKFYKSMGGHLVNARRGRIIPFDAIRDDGVTTHNIDRFADKDEFLATVRGMASSYKRDLMAAQDVHVEVHCEAAGMLPQLVKVASPFSIRCYSSSGFDSLTAKKGLAERICDTGKAAVILHLGDYDPSGQGIFNAQAEDVRAFVEADRLHAMVEVEFRRIALNRDQVEAFGLPTAPAKSTDSRARSWIGGTCQLEALAPDQIAEILQIEIGKIIDPVRMYRDRVTEQDERTELTRLLLN